MTKVYIIMAERGDDTDIIGVVSKLDDVTRECARLNENEDDRDSKDIEPWYHSFKEFELIE